MCQMGNIFDCFDITGISGIGYTTVDRRAVIPLIEVCERNYFTWENKNSK